MGLVGRILLSKHSLKALALYSMSESNATSNGFSSSNVPNEALGINGLDQGTPLAVASSETFSTISSYAGRLDYNYDSKYIFSATFRADGSSKFAKENRWGYFPGISAAWNMAEENFFKNIFPAVSSSKFRFSYGINGNNRIGDFSRFASIGQGLSGYSFNNQMPEQYVVLSSLPNNDLKWEKTAKLDLGYELGLWKERLGFEVDIYRNKTTDLLLLAPLPPTSGFTSAYKNVGSLQNQGLEIGVNAVIIQNGSFNWNSSFNISFNENKILSLTEGQVNIGTNVAFESQYNTPLYLSRIGHSTGMMYGYIWDGNYQYEDFDNPAPGVYILKPSVPSNGNPRNSILPGDIKYKDINGDGVVNGYDKGIIGRGKPIHTGGFNNNITYKNFSVNAFIQWSYGNNVYNANRLSLEGNSNGRSNMNQYKSYVDRWSPDNQDSKNFRAGGQGPVGYHSSRVVEDGSFIRLKTLSVEYSVPRKYIGLLHINELILNAAAQNLLTLTKYSGLDPEVSVGNFTLSPGYDYSAYPQNKTIVFGIKAVF